MKKNISLFREALVESWLGFSCLIAYIYFCYTGSSQVVIGGFAIAMAVLFMNGLAKTELFLTSKCPSWWKFHPRIRWLHHIHEEGELMGIAVGVTLFLSMHLRHSGLHVHIPYAGALTLIGIISAANLALKNIIPIMGFIEKCIGIQGTLIFGSFLSSLTGASASVIISEYFKDRILEENRGIFAVKFAASLGLGNGILPFASPPILIVWTTLQEKLDWGLGDLLIFVGIPAIIYSLFITYKIGNIISPKTNEKCEIKFTPLLVMISIVVANIYSYDDGFTMGMNFLAGISGLSIGHNFHERASAWILGALLIALEIIGVEGEEFISFLTSFIPKDIHPLFLGLILFYVTAFLSHFADNALSSKLVMGAATSSPAFVVYGVFLATSVLLGALSGGFALIPANIPNFPIARILKIDPGVWKNSALKIYWTLSFFFVWLTGLYYFGEIKIYFLSFLI